MGAVYKKTITKPLPAGAKIIVRKGQRLAQWQDAKGKTRTAPLTVGKDGKDRLVITSRTYTAKYRDGSGIVREVSTGCRDESAARSILTELGKRADKVRSGIRSSAEDAVIDHQPTPLAEHIAAYIDHQRAKGLSRRVDDVQRQLRRVAADCGFRRLADLNGTALVRWLAAHQAEGMSAATRNEYRIAWVMFGNWCIHTRRLLSNPLTDVPRADAKADPRRRRRALTEDELRRLLDAAHRRPLLDAMTIRCGERRGKVVAVLRGDIRRQLERLGMERALAYKTLVLTGLRKGELASLTVGQLDLDAPMPSLVLEAADEKNGQGSTIPLRADLVADLRGWLADKAAALQEAARNATTVEFDSKHQSRQERNHGDSAGPERQSCLPLTRLPANTRVFNLPHDLSRVLDKDLVAAGIARRVKVDGKWKIDKRDERGRTVDVHALRHTFGTHLSKGGVSPRTAQAAMRHSTIDLTMNVYTDPKLLDVAGAMDSLPSLPISTDPWFDSAALPATGTDNSTPSPFAPAFAPTTGKPITPESIPDKQARWEDPLAHGRKQQENPCFSGVFRAEGTGLEPATPFLGHHISSVAASHSLTLRNCLRNFILRRVLSAVKGCMTPQRATGAQKWVHWRSGSRSRSARWPCPRPPAECHRSRRNRRTRPACWRRSSRWACR